MLDRSGRYLARRIATAEACCNIDLFFARLVECVAQGEDLQAFGQDSTLCRVNEPNIRHTFNPAYHKIPIGDQVFRRPDLPSPDVFGAVRTAVSNIEWPAIEHCVSRIIAVP